MKAIGKVGEAVWAQRVERTTTISTRLHVG
jgi:hypothetical protein